MHSPICGPDAGASGPPRLEPEAHARQPCTHGNRIYLAKPAAQRGDELGLHGEPISPLRWTSRLWVDPGSRPSTTLRTEHIPWGLPLPSTRARCCDDGVVTTGITTAVVNVPWARFDDVILGTGLMFSSPHRVLVASSTSEVAPVLDEVDRATREGSWAFGYVAYEAAPGLDAGLAVCDRELNSPPLVWFGISDEPARVPPVCPSSGEGYNAATWQPGWTPAEYGRDVACIREHIAAGDIYECNLTVRLRSRVEGDMAQMYADLVLNQRTHYGAYLDIGQHVIASASPELFFQWVEDRLLTRPMKGTAARGRTQAEDQERVQGLVNSAKERAENVIVVDLLRNDVSRVAAVGSVSVPVLCAPERYETVWQLTSDVTGKVPEGTSLVDVFRALFPSGSVTGAPKQRAMEIISDVENSPRGVYCGVIGMVAPPGAKLRAQFSVAIRTMVADRATGSAVYGTGGAITWASEPDTELAEVHAKAAILQAHYRDFHLLETMAHVPGKGVRHLDRHLARLGSSARYFCFAFDDERARAEVAAATEHAGSARVRLVLTRHGALSVELSPLPPPSLGPVRLAVDPEQVDSSQRWLYHKTSNRGTYTSRAGRHPHADDVVLVNERGQVTETSTANLAVQLDGTWWTPPVDAGCLPGIERGRLVELRQLRERPLTPEDLRRADALAVLNSLRGWRPAALITGAFA
jgi:para-aminobenzoate synthetase/4-amino-4-deoxychorismate lyase